MAAKAHELIEVLREEIRRIERRPAPRTRFTPSGRADVDAQLPGGGFPRGAVTELWGGYASGKTGLALAALAAAMGEEGLAAFVDGRGELYPPAASALGVDLDRLLIVRPCARTGTGPRGDGVRDALWAAEALLGSGAFEIVAVDIPLERSEERLVGARLDGMLRRVRAAAERGGAVALWLSTPGGVRVPAAVRLEIAAGAAGVQVRRTWSHGSGVPCPAQPGAFHAA
jgi:protein ImuA